MIRPIFNALSAGQQTSEKKLEPQFKEQTASIPNNLIRAPKSTSLQSLIKEKEPAFQPFKNESTKRSTPFKTENLIQYWDKYAEAIEEKVHLKNTMINCKPVLSDKFNFEVKVYNPVQKEELISNSLDLLKFLRTQLKNDMVQMTVRIDENIEKKKVYTSTEKFKFLNHINPLLSKLIDEFDLTID